MVAPDWRALHAVWFPPGLDASFDTHRAQFLRWFAGGGPGPLAAFAPLLTAARTGVLESWTATAQGRLALILVLDQLPRVLHAGTPAAYEDDRHALAQAEAGLAAGDYTGLATPWEKTFFLLPLAHAEGPDHLARLDRAVGLTQALVAEAPAPLRPLYEHSANQARGHRDVIARFGRYPHRNTVLGRASTPAERVYLDRDQLVHQRAPPER